MTDGLYARVYLFRRIERLFLLTLRGDISISIFLYGNIIISLHKMTDGFYARIYLFTRIEKLFLLTTRGDISTSILLTFYLTRQMSILKIC